MTRPRRSAPVRGATLVEVMVSAALLLVAMIGFVGSMKEAANATAVGHRRTVGTYVRGELLETILMTPRDRLVLRPANAWLVDTCYDIASQPLAQNTTFASPYDCPPNSVYRSWARYEPQPNLTLAVHAYVERIFPGCDPNDRYRSLACTAADVFVSD